MKKIVISLFALCIILSCGGNSETPINDDPTPNNEDFKVIEYDVVQVQKNYSTPIFVHYMPWFESPEFAEFPESSKGNWGVHWTMANKNPENTLSNGDRDIASHYYPIIGPYDNGEPDYCEYVVSCMKLTGLDGVIFDYPGITDVYDGKLLRDHTDALIPWLEKAGLQFSIMYEDGALNNAIEQNVITDKIAEGKRVLKHMSDNFFKKDSYFKLDNIPVLLNFGPQALKTNQEWLDVFSEIRDVNFFPLAYHGQSFNLTSAMDGAFAWVGETLNNDFYNYSKQFTYTAGGALYEYKEFYTSGGWGATGQTEISHNNGNTLRESLQRAKDANVDFIQVVTWNDWGEGTAIEPSKEHKFNQLNIIQDFLGVSYNSNDLELPIKLYQKRKEHKGKDLENKKLDQVFQYLISLQIDKARTLLNEL